MNVAGTNPSPAEITEGIRSISSMDLTLATATEDDVMLGKTYYAQNSELKTGRANIDNNVKNHIFMAPPLVQTTIDDIYYAVPENVTIIRPYVFYNNLNKIHITFSSNLQEIQTYSFYKAKNFTFENFNELTKLKRIGSYSMAYTFPTSIDFSALPASLESVETYGFYNALTTNSSLTLPAGLQSLAQSAFRTENRTVLRNFQILTTKLTNFNNFTFYNLCFNADFVVPSQVKNISSNMAYNGSFKNTIFHSGVANLYTNCFGADSSRANSDFNMETATFLGEIPPVFGPNVFAQQHVNNGLKIYVPDNAVDVYKAANNFTIYSNIIYPMSEKD